MSTETETTLSLLYELVEVMSDRCQQRGCRPPEGKRCVGETYAALFDLGELYDRDALWLGCEDSTDTADIRVSTAPK